MLRKFLGFGRMHENNFFFENVLKFFFGRNGGEREGKKNCKNMGRGAGFWPTLDPIFSSFRP